MTADHNALQHFIAPLVSHCVETYDWPAARFTVNTYLHDQLPPEPFVRSVRAIVLGRHGTYRSVVVVQDPDGYHIMPGGRREAGESYVDTVTREVREETGWQVKVGRLLGFKHFYRLTPKPPEIRYDGPDFVQLVYTAVAESYHADALEQDGYEIGAAFVELDALTQYNITAGERLFLEAALT